MTPNPLLWVIPALPLAGFILNAFMGSSMNKKASGALATVAVWAAFVVSLLVFQQVQQAPDHRLFSPAIDWIPAIKLKLELCVDPLSALMLLVITGVGALIHGYSMGYMSHEKNYSRYFTYLNLFVFFMLLLVMGANLVVMFVGWEGVGLASYLLIGFWQEKKSATDAGKKAFVVNRIGDAALLLALFGLYWVFDTLDFFGPLGIVTKTSAMLEPGGRHGDYHALTTLVPILLFVGATGKSAQFPLYVWLPDAMEGPTPVSALIHAATMVTAGVYLLTRLSAIFLISPVAMTVVAAIGLFTALLAASIALAQNDIKKILAYSTVSQLGFMFLACGVGAFGAAMFHVVTHAFFKALLFLGSGSVIHAMGGEQDVRKMGGLWKKLPITGRTMAIGTAAISGIPLLAGFWSKDEILLNAFAGKSQGGLGGPIYWIVAFFTAGLTAFYMTRLMVKTFAGAPRYDEHVASHLHESPISMTLPLGILAVLSVVGGFMNAAPLGIHAFEHWLEPVVKTRELTVHSLEFPLMAASGIMALIVCGWAFFRFRSKASGEYAPKELRESRIYAMVANRWGIDQWLDSVFKDEGTDIARWMRRFLDNRGADGAVNGFVRGVRALGEGLKGWQSGYVRSYALTMLVGVLVVVVASLLGRAR